MASFNLIIWKYLYEKGLRKAEEVDRALEKGILTQSEHDEILRK